MTSEFVLQKCGAGKPYRNVNLPRRIASGRQCARITHAICNMRHIQLFESKKSAGRWSHI